MFLIIITYYDDDNGKSLKNKTIATHFYTLLNFLDTSEDSHGNRPIDYVTSIHTHGEI